MMKKINSEFFKGIEFIRIANLPEDQRVALLAELDPEHLINIQINSKVEKNCVLYTDYSYWFDHSFITRDTSTLASNNKKKNKQVGYAFD